jgi:SEC-C motif domain protein
MSKDLACPCGSGNSLATCCGPFIDGAAAPQTAEALMRSRYTAHRLGRENYLQATWHPTTRRQSLDLDETVKWLGLKIIHTCGGGPLDNEGLVEFVARFKIGGRAHRLREVSRFVRMNGLWVYVNADAQG